MENNTLETATTTTSSQDQSQNSFIRFNIRSNPIEYTSDIWIDIPLSTQFVNDSEGHFEGVLVKISRPTVAGVVRIQEEPIADSQ